MGTDYSFNSFKYYYYKPDAIIIIPLKIDKHQTLATNNFSFYWWKPLCQISHEIKIFRVSDLGLTKLQAWFRLNAFCLFVVSISISQNSHIKHSIDLYQAMQSILFYLHTN